MYSKRQIKLIENWEEQSWSINFQAEIIKKKKHLELQTFQQLCNMTSTSLRKMWVHFLEMPFLKYNENILFFLLKNTYN